MQFGRCREISTSGMKVELRDRATPGSRGTIDLSYENLSLMVGVLVERSEPDYDSMQFVRLSSGQREHLERLVACLTTPRPCTNLVPRV